MHSWPTLPPHSRTWNTMARAPGRPPRVPSPALAQAACAQTPLPHCHGGQACQRRRYFRRRVSSSPPIGSTRRQSLAAPSHLAAKPAHSPHTRMPRRACLLSRVGISSHCHRLDHIHRLTIKASSTEGASSRRRAAILVATPSGVVTGKYHDGREISTVGR